MGGQLRTETGIWLLKMLLTTQTAETWESDAGIEPAILSLKYAICISHIRHRNKPLSHQTSLADAMHS
nr:MAG TPA: hypothetical protein [Bacteriophage sp.]